MKIIKVLFSLILLWIMSISVFAHEIENKLLRQMPASNFQLNIQGNNGSFLEIMSDVIYVTIKEPFATVYPSQNQA